MCFVSTWAYLTYLHIYVIQSLYTKWVCQIVALRVVGLAFEVQRLQRLNRFQVPYTASTATLYRENEVQMRWGFEPPEVINIEPTAVDMISYAFYFIGIHKGSTYLIIFLLLIPTWSLTLGTYLSTYNTVEDK